MKRIYLGVAAAMMALFSACENAALPEPVSPEGNLPGDAEKTQIFTATLGADTKVYLDYDADQNVYKTVWSENDYIYVINPETGDYERCALVEGAGTTTAKFVGSIKADQYLAFYGNINDCNRGMISTYISPYQGDTPHWNDETGREEYQISEFPMAAKSTTTSFDFKNLCSVLKVNLTGNGEFVYTVKVIPNDSEAFVGGSIDVDFSGEEPEVIFKERYNPAEVVKYLYRNIYQTPTELYIFLPAQTYKGGFTFVVETERHSMEVSVTDDIEMRRSRIRNLNLEYKPTTWKAPNEEWGVRTTTGEEIAMAFEGGYMVARGVKLNKSTGFVFVNKTYGEELGLPYNYYNYFRYMPLNTAVWMEYWANPMTVIAESKYDIYFDTYECRGYVMLSGFTLDDIPTKYEVLGWDYSRIYYMSNSSIVKVQGMVIATAGHGVVLMLDSYTNNAIFVSDPDGSLSDLKPGDYVDLYAEKSENNGLAELIYRSGEHWANVLGSYSTFSYESSYDTTNELDNYSRDRYEYVSIDGTLQNIDGEFVVSVDGSTALAHITQPLVDLSSYDGKRVYLEGYYVGRSESDAGVPFVNLVMTKIGCVDTNGSTNDVLPGDDITVTM